MTTEYGQVRLIISKQITARDKKARGRQYMTAAIEVNNLSKVYGKGKGAFDALKDMNFSIVQGESVAIIGKSGSGKSTLMHQLALLDTPTSGKLLIGGVDSTQLSAKQLDLIRNKEFGFVFQQFFLNGSDTVLDNVILPLKIAGLSPKERKRLALAALQAVELEDKANEKAVNLSGGQKQRVCIARALVNKPKVIFADEPTGNLDSHTGDKIIDLLFELNKRENITLIVVTHDLELARKCKRQILIKDGRIMKDLHP
jgi:putative ABC transport system ATP-binding protein